MGVPPEVSKPEMKKAESERGSKKAEGKAPLKDKLEISSVGRELLSLRSMAASAEHIESVKQAQTLKEEDVALIKERIEANFYNDPNVIEKILDELLELPYFAEGSPFIEG